MMLKLLVDIKNNANDPRVRATLQAMQRNNPQARNIAASLLNSPSPTEHGTANQIEPFRPGVM